MMQLLMAAALYVLAAARLPAMFRFGKDAVFCAALLAGTAALLTNPGVYTFVDPLLGGHNAAKLIQHTLMVFGLWQLRVCILQAVAPESKPRHGKHRSLPLYLTLILQTVFFFTTDAAPTTTDFSGTYNTRLEGALFSATVLLFAGVVCAELAIVCRRFVPRMHGAFKVGFTMVGLGSAWGAVSAVFMILDVLASAMPAMAAWSFHSTALYEVMRLVPTALVGQGLTVPALAGRAERKRTERWEQETLARVQLIWGHALGAAGLDRSLAPDSNAPAQDRLHRLIVEIWDVELAMGGASPLTAEEHAYLLSVEHKLDLERLA